MKLTYGQTDGYIISTTKGLCDFTVTGRTEAIDAKWIYRSTPCSDDVMATIGQYTVYL